MTDPFSMVKYYIIEQRAEAMAVNKAGVCSENNWLISDEEDDLASAKEFKTKRDKFIAKYFTQSNRITKIISGVEKKKMEKDGTKFYPIYSAKSEKSLSKGRERMTKIL